MMVLQGGAVEFFAMIAILFMALFAIGYFVVLPFYALRFLTKKWRERPKSILIATYIILALSLGFCTWYLPSYFWEIFKADVTPPPLNSFAYIYQAILIAFLSLPVIFTGVVWSINLMTRSHGHVVTSEGCNQPSGCKMGEKEHE